MYIFFYQRKYPKVNSRELFLAKPKSKKSILHARRLFVKKRFPEFYLRMNNNENIRRNILNEFPLSTSDLFFSRGQRVSRAALNWKLYEMYDLTYEWAYFRSFFDF